MINPKDRYKQEQTLYDRLDKAGILPDDYEGAVVITGYDAACIGYSDDGRLVYDYDLLVAEEMNAYGVDWETAADYVEYNIVGGYLSTGMRHPYIVHMI